MSETDSTLPGRALVAVAPDLICEMLHMPESAAIVDVSWSDDGRNIELLVESSDLPPGFHGTANPTVTRHVERFEWSWGVES